MQSAMLPTSRCFSTDINDYQTLKRRKRKEQTEGNETTGYRTYTPKKVKFSSFQENEGKDYPVEADKMEYVKNRIVNEPFIPKKEVTHEGFPFDPSIRLRLPKMPLHEHYNAMQGYQPEVEPQSCYVAVHHNGHTYHLFNAKRMPVGRMAVLIAQFIRGKHRPGYMRNATGVNEKTTNVFDTCIVVNIDDPFMTGRKMQQKLYRHHTGYPGGLKTFTYKHVRETKPERILTEAVMGMLPKNKNRE